MSRFSKDDASSFGPSSLEKGLGRRFQVNNLTIFKKLQTREQKRSATKYLVYFLCIVVPSMLYLISAGWVFHRVRLSTSLASRPIGTATWALVMSIYGAILSLFVTIRNTRRKWHYLNFGLALVPVFLNLIPGALLIFWYYLYGKCDGLRNLLGGNEPTSFCNMWKAAAVLAVIQYLLWTTFSIYSLVRAEISRHRSGLRDHLSTLQVELDGYRAGSSTSQPSAIAVYR